MTPETFRAWRKRLNLKQREAADRLGVSPSTVQKWEGGQSPIPDLAPLACAAVAFGLPPYGDKAA